MIWSLKYAEKSAIRQGLALESSYAEEACSISNVLTFANTADGITPRH